MCSIAAPSPALDALILTTSVLCFCLFLVAQGCTPCGESMLQHGTLSSCGSAVMLFIVRIMHEMHFGIARACDLSATTSKCYQTYVHSQGPEKGVGVQGLRL